MNEEWENGLKTKKYHFVQQCGIKSREQYSRHFILILPYKLVWIISVTLQQARNASQGQTLSYWTLLWVMKKMKGVYTYLGASVSVTKKEFKTLTLRVIFTTLNFVHNLLMGPIRYSVCP
jgi:hypothetical protein